MSCSRANPLVRGGTAQRDRFPGALDPGSVVLDDRDAGDLLRYARRYARGLTYYAPDNTPSGTWEPFWTGGLAPALAGLEGLELGQVAAADRNLIAEVSRPGPLPVASAAAARYHLAVAFALPAATVSRARTLVGGLPGDHPIAAIAQRTLDDLHASLARIHDYYQGARAAFGPDPGDPGDTRDPWPPTDFSSLLDAPPPRYLVLPAAVRELIPDGARAFADYDEVASPGAIERGGGPYASSPDEYGKVFDALHYNLFTAARRTVYERLAALAQHARVGLGESLASYGSHPPHIALYLAFVELFGDQQRRVNALPDRHLAHYYRDVLRLRPRVARADHAHLTLELKPRAAPLRLRAGQRFDGGEDPGARPRHYVLGEDAEVDHAGVAELRSVVRPPGVDWPVAAADVRSIGGLGDEPLPPGQPFDTFFRGGDPPGPPARLGFAVASHLLWLAGGERAVTIDTAGATPPPASCRVYYTGLEGWERVGDVSTADADGLPRITLGLPSDAPAVVGFDPEVHVDDAEHADRFATGIPVVKVVCATDLPAWNALRLAGGAALRVSVDGLRELAVQNRDGRADTAQPFALFGVEPDPQPSFLLGASEALAKPIASATLGVDWEEAYEPADWYGGHAAEDYDLRVEYLRGGAWLGEQTYTENRYALLPEPGEVTRAVTVEGIFSGAGFDPVAPSPVGVYGSGVREGWMRFTLDRSFGHRAYRRAYVEALTERATAPTTPLPKEPYPARVTGLSLDYDSEPVAPSVFQLLPFGHRERPTGEPLVRAAPAADAPQSPGALYVGLARFEAPGRVRLYLEVAGGTADPLARPPLVEWHVLAGDVWLGADEGLAVDDRTRRLTESGLVVLDVPAAATVDHSLMPGGLHWLRLTAKPDPEAVAEDASAATASAVLLGLHRLRLVAAQGVRVTLAEVDGALPEPGTPLPAGSIGKAITPPPGLAGVAQPFPSFGGATAEPPPAFRARTAERLRHKGRAVQIWDYERLVLAEFPELHRVKCLNHTRVDDGRAPGHVTVVCVPRVSPTDRDPFRPYVRRSTLDRVAAFLRARTSPMVELHVVQPAFEPVELFFYVRFREEAGNPDRLRDYLHDALQRYLSPWTFDESEEIAFGGGYSRSQLVDFLDERPEVDYVTDFAFVLGDDAEPSTDTPIPPPATPAERSTATEHITARTARSILVPAAEHQINLIPS